MHIKMKSVLKNKKMISPLPCVTQEMLCNLALTVGMRSLTRTFTFLSFFTPSCLWPHTNSATVSGVDPTNTNTVTSVDIRLYQVGS